MLRTAEEDQRVERIADMGWMLGAMKPLVANPRKRKGHSIPELQHRHQEMIKKRKTLSIELKQQRMRMHDEEEKLKEMTKRHQKLQTKLKRFPISNETR